MKTNVKLLIIFFMLSGCILRADNVLPAGRLFMSVLQQNGTARVMAMGSSGVSFVGDSSALFWNPAGLGRVERVEIGLHHNSGLDNSGKETLVIGSNMNEWGGFAMSLNYGNSGSFDVRDESGNLTGIENALGYGISLGWGKMWQNGVSAGIALKAQREILAESDYNEFAVDAGLMWEIIPLLNLGLTYTNLGNLIHNFAPASGLRAGISYDMESFYKSRVLLAAAAEIQSNGTARFNMGIEDVFAAMFSVRLGYTANLTNQELTGITGITTGIGVKIEDVAFDYAYLPFGNLGANHRVSFTYVTDFFSETR